jgi:hypothetical protein
MRCPVGGARAVAPAACASMPHLQVSGGHAAHPLRLVPKVAVDNAASGAVGGARLRLLATDDATDVG